MLHREVFTLRSENHAKHTDHYAFYGQNVEFFNVKLNVM